MRLPIGPLIAAPSAAAGHRRAVFIDKDGTLVEDVPYNVDPALLRFTPNAVEALGRLSAAGFLLVVISNQPGLALGRFDLAALHRLAAALAERLSAEGVVLAGFYACPHLPIGAGDGAGTPGDGAVRPGIRAVRVGDGTATPGDRTTGCDCRKPAPGLLLNAAAELSIDLGASWMVGDILDDVEAGQRAGCRTIHLDVGNETVWRRSPLRQPTATVPHLLAAAEVILANRAAGAEPAIEASRAERR